MVHGLFSRDLFAEVDRLHRELQQSFDTFSPSIRGWTRGYPALNVGSTPTSVEIYAFAPGIDPARIEVQLERGVLTIEGERRSTVPQAGQATGDAGSAGGNGAGKAAAPATHHIAERFEGRFRRVVSLPDDIDPAAVQASYRDGVLHVSVQRRASAQPRRIDVQ